MRAIGLALLEDAQRPASVPYRHLMLGEDYHCSQIFEVKLGFGRSSAYAVMQILKQEMGVLSEPMPAFIVVTA